MLLGIAGTYRKHETVDVQYEVNGRPRVASNLKPEPRVLPSGNEDPLDLK